MKIISKIFITLSLFILFSCSSSFDCKHAKELLQKEELTAEDYSEMLQIYEDGIDDALKFSKDTSKELTGTQKEEMRLIFAIGMRLSKDDVNLSPEQRLEFERINLKGKENTPD